MKISSSWHQEEAGTMLRQQILVLIGHSHGALSEKCHFHLKGTSFLQETEYKRLKKKSS